MVDEEKIRIMTRIASFEKKEDIREIKESGYYKSDYIRSHLLEVAWSYSVAYFLILLLIALYHLDYLTSGMDMSGFGGAVIAAVVIYLLLLLCSLVAAAFYYAARYEEKQGVRTEYCNELWKLEQYYEKGKEGDSE